MAFPLAKQRAWFRSWRRTRPFWAGVFVMVGGAVIILLPLAPLPIMLKIGFAAIAGVAIGLVLIIGGLLFWFTPSNRVFVAVITAGVSVFSLVASNLGGFIVGMMAGIIGSCLAFGWTPDKQRKPRPASEPAPEPVLAQRPYR